MRVLVRLQIPALILGVIAAALLAAGWASPEQRPFIFRGYLFAYVFCLGLGLGSVCLLLLHNLTGGAWGDQIRPLARAGAATVPLLLVFFVPLCFGLTALYPWARPEEVAAEPLWRHRQVYLNPPFFLLRALLYFIIWLGLALLAVRRRPPGRGLSAVGLILYLWTMTHAGIDWIMSRDVDFYSTALGFVLTVGQTLAALALCTLLVPLVTPPPERLPEKARASIYIDLGNVLLTVVILWMYVSFMQFLVVWMGNEREDNAWYLQRGISGNMTGPDVQAWRVIGSLIVLFHFFVPFYLLLFRGAKRHRVALPAIAGVLLAAHLLETYWLIAPSGHGPAPRFDPHWQDLAAIAALGLIWLAALLFLLQRLPAPAPGRAPEGVPAHE